MNAPWTQPAEPNTVDDLKRRYAGLLHTRPDSPVEHMHAARLLFPRGDQTGLALSVAQDWPHDPVVIEELDRLKISEAGDELPSKVDVARRYLNWADDKSWSEKDRLTALDKYAEIMGMKPQTGGGFGGVNVNVDARRVFVLPKPSASLEEWELEASAQQAKLVGSSSGN